MLTVTSDLSSLLGRVAERDRAAFALLYQATAAKLYGIVLRILRRRELADEVLQEVFVKIWERAGDFRPAQGSPIAWMAAIARNRALDEIRRRQPASSADPADALNIADPGMSAPDAMVRDEDRSRLDRCLDALEGDMPAMVRLAYLEGWSREQLARKFGAPVPTIKTWLRRSLMQLKDCLES